MAETRKILVLALSLGTCLGAVARPAPAAAQVSSMPSEQSFNLMKERGRLHSLTPNVRHVYRVDIKAGQLLSATFEQLVLDISLDLLGPAGELLSTVDSPNGYSGEEPVLLVARQPGTYTIVVTTGDSTQKYGAYRISKAQVRQATPRDRERADALQSYYAASKEKDPAKRLQALQKAMSSLERTLAPKTLRANAWQKLGGIFESGKKWTECARSHKRAAQLFHELGLRQDEAVALISAGNAELKIASVDQAIKDFERALSLAKSIGDESTEALASTHLGSFYAQRADAWNAKPYLERAIAIREKHHEVDEECRALNAKALLLRNLGQYEEAFKIYQDMLQRLKPSRQVRASVLAKVGSLYTQTGNPEGAFRYLKEALELQKKGDLYDQANTLNAFGMAYTKKGDFGNALTSYQKVLDISTSQNDLPAQAASLLNIGWALGSLKRYDEAAGAFGDALALARRLEQPYLESGALFGMAWMERLRGNFAGAVQWATETVRRIESTRSGVTDPDDRLAYFASWQDAYDFLIRALMEQYALRPSRDLLEKALQASERARSRALLDALGERDGVAATRLAPVLSARQIQRQVLDPDTVLLEYSLGQPKSYLLLVTPDEIERFELPPREDLEALASDVHAALANSQTPAECTRALKKARELSRLLIGPVAKRLGRKRLLIVASGALELVPFGALPDPAVPESQPHPDLDWPEPLLKNHEILLEPSASVLSGIREIRAGRRSASGLLAILADPVYGLDDVRFTRTRSTGSNPAPSDLERLPASAEEAQAISAGLPAAKVFKALGFAATRELLTSGRLKDYRILHIAAHNDYSEKNPASSELFFSRYDKLGRPLNGVLRIKDISTQDLRSDLVVLSACGSALGKQVRGEGIVGWPWAFLSAGASEVVMSFWKIGDTSTSELMQRFYKNMTAGLSPSDALREAQLHLWGKGKAPRVWGGFMAQGEWNLHPLSLNKNPAAVSSQDGDPRSPTMTRKSPPTPNPR